ncbi:MAG: GNAT family N-acetyltransferase [Capsulimonadales bacterium]|nr:GNAT family N-acetyltransferase [Capsulimonadales bacterium]
MSIEIRELSPDDKHRHEELMSHAFGKGRVVPPPAPDAEPAEMKGVWGLYESGQLRASLIINSYTCYWGAETILAMGGIGGVATFAEARGRGFVEQLLRRSLEVMRESGQTVSSLFPFAWAFYRKQGWDWVGERHAMKLPLREVRSYPEGKKVVCLTGPEHRARLEPGYAAFARRYNGMFTAETHAWNGKLAHHEGRTTYVYLYEPTGEYFCWRYDAGGNQGQCHDFCVHSPEGHRALLSILHYLGTQCPIARVSVPSDQPLWSYVYHWELETEARPVFMGRVVDFDAVLTRLTVPPDVPNGAVTIRLADEQAPWNDGLRKVTVEDGKLAVSSVIGTEEADVATDIQAMSQAIWGMPSLKQLGAAGRIDIRDEERFRWLCRVLPGAPVFIMDDF